MLALGRNAFAQVETTAIASSAPDGYAIGVVDSAFTINPGLFGAKLPYDTVMETYDLEYGSASVELHVDAVQQGQRVLLMDDLIATGGTMLAGLRLLQKVGAEVVEGAAIIDLPDLGGSRRIREAGLPLYTLLDFAGE